MPEHMAPKLILDRPQIGRMAHNDRTVNLPQHGKPIAVMAAEVGVNPFVGVDSQECPHDFDRQHFTVCQLRLWSTLAETLSFELIADQAEHFDHESGMIHGEAPFRFDWFCHHEAYGGFNF